MKGIKVKFFLSLIVLISSVYILLTGSPILNYELMDDPRIPAGTPITWLGFIALPLMFYFGITRIRVPQNRFEKFINIGFKTLIIAGAFWGFICFLLANNWSNSFSSQAERFRGSVRAGEIFWKFNYVLAALPLVLVIILKFKRLINSHGFKNKF